MKTKSGFSYIQFLASISWFTVIAHCVSFESQLALSNILGTGLANAKIMGWILEMYLANAATFIQCTVTGTVWSMCVWM